MDDKTVGWTLVIALVIGVLGIIRQLTVVWIVAFIVAAIAAVFYLKHTTRAQ
jgi:hypothetical protein